MNNDPKVLYPFILDYARRNKAANIEYCALYLKNMMDNLDDQKKAFTYFRHALSVSDMFINLHLALSDEEKDIAIAASLIHVIPDVKDYASVRENLIKDENIDNRVIEIIDIITRPKDADDLFYRRIEENKLALIIRLIDRSDMVSGLYKLPVYTAKKYLFETREHFFPMCVYGKEHYQELYGSISIMMEKMRSITDTIEILMDKFEKEELALINEKLKLEEENARIRMLMNKKIA